jgi:hypothetical protein
MARVMHRSTPSQDSLAESDGRPQAVRPISTPVVWLAFFLAAVALCRPAPCSAQGVPADPPAHYTPQRTFRIPFRLDPTEQRIAEVSLYVSRDGRAYQFVNRVNPSGGFFLYTAADDGWYWFATQTRDAEGRFHPPDVGHLQPGLKVCVDTRRPVVTLRPAAPRDGSAVAVEWAIQDDNFDQLRLEYHPRNVRDPLAWSPVPVQQAPTGLQGWNPTVAGPVDVRLTARDRAGNQTEAFAYGLEPGQARPGLPPAPETGPVMHVKSLTFRLEYTVENVGPSDVQTVEVWSTSDMRQWLKMDKARATRQPGQSAPGVQNWVCEVTVLQPGRYGFTLIPRSGVGLAERTPQSGDPPQVWVQVDTSKPVVNLGQIVVNQNQDPDAGSLTVYWTASDTFLRAQPITISWSRTPTGPWQVLARDIANVGSHTVSLRGVSEYQFHVQVEAIDEAGNVGSAVTKSPVKVDLKVPRAGKVRVVPSGEAGDPRAPGGSPPPPPGGGPDGMSSSGDFQGAFSPAGQSRRSP